MKTLNKLSVEVVYLMCNAGISVYLCFFTALFLIRNAPKYCTWEINYNYDSYFNLLQRFHYSYKNIFGNHSSLAVLVPT